VPARGGRAFCGFYAAEDPDHRRVSRRRCAGWPGGGGIFTDRANIDTIASLGLILPLFLIGIEMDVRNLAACGGHDSQVS